VVVEVVIPETVVAMVDLAVQLTIQLQEPVVAAAVALAVTRERVEMAEVELLYLAGQLLRAVVEVAVAEPVEPVPLDSAAAAVLEYTDKAQVEREVPQVLRQQLDPVMEVLVEERVLLETVDRLAAVDLDLIMCGMLVMDEVV
jgi:hypothetical protein